MIPSKTPIRFYWQMVDHFLRKPGTWRFLGTDWQAECVLPTERKLALRAIITAGLSYKTGKYTMAARVRVEGGTSLAFSRAAQRDLAGVKERLRRRGFRWRDEPLAHYPLSAWKTVTPRSFTGERRFLSELTEQDFSAVERHSPRSLSNLLDAFRGRFSDWRPLHAQWELRKPIFIAGRPATGIFMFHLAPADRKGRLGAASSITIWPPWDRKGRLPVWLASNRRLLDAQYRATGHRAEWHRGPGGRGIMITSMREDLAGIEGIVRERRALEAARFGDPH
jgi:hypothetical protein